MHYRNLRMATFSRGQKEHNQPVHRQLTTITQSQLMAERFPHALSKEYFDSSFRVFECFRTILFSLELIGLLLNADNAIQHGSSDNIKKGLFQFFCILGEPHANQSNCNIFSHYSCRSLSLWCINSQVSTILRLSSPPAKLTLSYENDPAVSALF